jgi:DNA-binding MarR family transcriptional regulator
MSKLQQELRKREPFASAEQEAVLGLFRTSDRMQHRFARLFREYGLTPSQYNILRILRGEGKPMPCLAIAQRTITVVPGITGLIDRLAEAGFVLRQRSEEDRRVVNVSITTAGEEVLARLDEPLIQLHRELMGSFSAEELAELIRLLDKARQACEGESS